MRRTIGGVLVIGALTLAACGSSSGSDAGSSDTTTTTAATGQAPPTTEAPTTTVAAAPEPTAEVLFTYTNEDPLLRFAVEIKNPAGQARVGVRTTWKALDANGVIVGTLEDTERPAIPAGGSIYYAGGAGGANLSGTPASVQFEITDPGTLTDSPPAAVATADNATFEEDDFSLYEGAREFEVSFVITATQDLETADLNGVLLLKDANGKVIGADWADTSSAPSTLKAGEKANATASVAVTTGEPVTAEAYIYS